MLISVSNTSIDKDTVMIGFGDAPLAHTAMLGASWLQQVTSAANVTRVEIGVIIGIK